MQEKKRVLIVCTGNACRSQMAEGWVRHDLGTRWRSSRRARIPGSSTRWPGRSWPRRGGSLGPFQQVHPPVRRGGVSICVITVCDSARELCPVFPGAGKQLHESIEDPVGLGLNGDEEMEAFRRTRDEIRQRIVALVRREVEGAGPGGDDMSEQEIKAAVRQHYATIAVGNQACCAPASAKDPAAPERRRRPI